MKLLNYDLTGWERHEYNHYRNAYPSNGKIYIGLILISRDEYPFNWRMTCWYTGLWSMDDSIPRMPSLSPICDEIEQHYNKWYNPEGKLYLQKDLDSAKIQIDIFIEKLNKLKLFL